MERGQLIAVNGRIVEYDRYDKYLNTHFATEIEVDEHGNMTMTYVPCCFSNEELTEGFNKHNFTQDQWYGIVECIIRQNYDISPEDITEATDEIVGRCFSVTGIPNFDTLEDYIAEYMNR